MIPSSTGSRSSETGKNHGEDMPSKARMSLDTGTNASPVAIAKTKPVESQQPKTIQRIG